MRLVIEILIASYFLIVVFCGVLYVIATKNKNTNKTKRRFSK